MEPGLRVGPSGDLCVSLTQTCVILLFVGESDEDVCGGEGCAYGGGDPFAHGAMGRVNPEDVTYRLYTIESGY